MEFSNRLAEIVAEVSSENFNLSSERIGFLNYQFENIESFTKLYYLLEDKRSKDIFLKLLRFNMACSLCGRKNSQNKYALISDKEWNNYKEQAKHVEHVETDYIPEIIETFILDGYSYDDICCVNSGDYVFDCGPYTGNTAIYFKKKIRGKR